MRRRARIHARLCEVDIIRGPWVRYRADACLRGESSTSRTSPPDPEFTFERVDYARDETGPCSACHCCVKDGTLLGTIRSMRENGSGLLPTSRSHSSQNFAAQAVIAMENARLLDEIRQRQDELRRHLRQHGRWSWRCSMRPCDLAAWNRNFQQLLHLPDALLYRAPELSTTYLRYLTERGEFGEDVDPETQIARSASTPSAIIALRTNPPGRHRD